MKVQHERRLAALEKARQGAEGVELSLEEELIVVAGSALAVGKGTPRPERAFSAFAAGGMEALAGVDARVAAEVELAVATYAEGGMEALAALDARVADDALLRIGTLADRGLYLLPGTLLI